MRKVFWWLLVAMSVAMVGLCGGLVLSNAERGDTSSPAVSPAPEVKPNPSPRPGTIREGTWEVGTDVKPGKYKTSGALAGPIPLCYWHVEKHGDIIRQGIKDKTDAQDIVTLVKGETFNTHGCEDWHTSK